MKYIVSIHATQLNNGTLDALWDNESILAGEGTGSIITDIEGAMSITDVWSTVSHALELTKEKPYILLNEGIVAQYDKSEEEANTLAFISTELVLSITIIEIEVDNV